MIAVALLIAIIIPLISLGGIYKLDLYKTGEFKYMLVAFGAGLLAYLLASRINPAIMNAGHFGYNQMVQFVAPVVEEILKGLILFFLVRRKNFTYFIDGAIYGFTAGIGFAIIENFEYILGNSYSAMSVAINRVISTNLMHAAATATLGIILGVARFEKPLRQMLFSIGGLVLAILLHMGFNNLVTRVSSGLLLVYAFIVGGGAAVFIAYMIRRGLAVEKRWIGQTLGLPDRIEKGEVSAVQNIEKVDEILMRLDEKLGPETGEKIKKLLLVQARLGIQRKSVKKMEDEKMRLAIQAQVEALGKEMEILRREIGSYAMIYVRETHLEEIFSWQTALAARLEQQAQQPSTGPSWQDRLGDKLRSTNKDTQP